MRSPADMGTIQIDVTNACTLQCSNCTRFCGNHKKAFFMSYENFKQAVNSLDGFNGVTGVMGGEPTLHPEFERLVMYLQNKFGKKKHRNRLLYPQKDFIREIRRRECESCVMREKEDGTRYIKTYGPGLWSNMGVSYLKYYEIIQDTFEVQYLNDHLNPSYHQPGLFARKDLGISDEEWVSIRDNCWIQNEWSATITPKGAFFCEVAGALDMLFNGPGGWPVEPGWWKRGPEDFKDQLHWCEICGFALTTFVRNAREFVDDVSPSVYEMLKDIGSPKYNSGRINLVKIDSGIIADESKAEVKKFTSYDRYMEHYEDRFSKINSILYQCDFKEAYIDSGEKYGVELNNLIEGEKDWILLRRSKNADVSSLKELIGKVIWNPGVLHIGEEYLFFNKKASSLRHIGYVTISHMKNEKEFIEAWKSDKLISVKDFEEKTKLKKDSVHPGKRYAIWGAGLYGEFVADAIQGSGGELCFVADQSKEKQGASFAGTLICAPEYLSNHQDEYDFLVLAHFTKFEEMEKKALELGIPKKKIRLPYEL